MIQDAKTFMAVDTLRGAYGIAPTLEQAVKNCKREGGARGKVKLAVVAFSCERKDVAVMAGLSLNYEIPQEAQALRFEATL